jgi:ArsR family transcriptional regulator
LLKSSFEVGIEKSISGPEPQTIETYAAHATSAPFGQAFTDIKISLYVLPMLTEAIFRALADCTRLRIVRLLGSMELAVGEIAQVMGQSQPRVSRHIGILCDAGLAERRREGSWMFLRAASSSASENTAEDAASLAVMLAGVLARAEEADPEFAALCAQDRQRLSQVRADREIQAQDYFAAHADNWDQLRALHSSDETVEAALGKALAGEPLGKLLDIGTGTGRMAELFADRAEHVVALDRSLAMLRVARAKLQNLPTEQIELVQGDFTSLPFADDSFDTIVFHQVLHFASDPALVLSEAARVSRAKARVAIVDFASHNREELRARHAHSWLGFSDRQMAALLKEAGFAPATLQTLDDGELTVKIWVSQLRQSAKTINQTTKAL